MGHDFILAAVLLSAALCIRPQNILRKWFVTTVSTVSIHALQPYIILCGFSVMIQKQFFRVFQLFAPEFKYFYQKNTLEGFANDIHLVKMIENMK